MKQYLIDNHFEFYGLQRSVFPSDKFYDLITLVARKWFFTNKKLFLKSLTVSSDLNGRILYVLIKNTISHYRPSRFGLTYII